MDRQAKSIALEKAHVHDVYEKIAPHFSDTRYKAWPRVKEFLLQLEPGSIIADIGCGNGRYLPINGGTFKIGSDRCERLVDIASKNGYEVMVCDNIRLPYRDNCFDAVISIAVIHHFATVERRIQALQELSRILRPGGKLMVYVWAMEQKQRKFDSQDVLVPWHLQPRYHKHKHKAKRLQDLKNENSSYCSSTSDDEQQSESPGRSRSKPCRQNNISQSNEDFDTNIPKMDTIQTSDGKDSCKKCGLPQRSYSDSDLIKDSVGCTAPTAHAFQKKRRGFRREDSTTSEQSTDTEMYDVSNNVLSTSSTDIPNVNSNEISVGKSSDDEVDAARHSEACANYCESNATGKQVDHVNDDDEVTDVPGNGIKESADDSWVILDAESNQAELRSNEVLEKVVDGVNKLTAECNSADKIVSDGCSEKSDIVGKCLLNGFDNECNFPINDCDDSLSQISKSQGGSELSLDDDIEQIKKPQINGRTVSDYRRSAPGSDASDSTDNEGSSLRKTKSESWLLNISSRFSPKLLRLRTGRSTPPIAEISQAIAKGETYKPFRFSLKKKKVPTATLR